MVTTLKRLFWLAVLGGAGFAGWSLLRASRAENTPPSLPPSRGGDAARSRASGRADGLQPDGAARPAGPDPAAARVGQPARATAPRVVADALEAWVAPIDGACPASHPIKANANSGIFHEPGGRFYERTRPERCYATPEDAVADGYRAAKT